MSERRKPSRTRKRSDAPTHPEPAALVAAREDGDAERLTVALVEAAEQTPLFPHLALAVIDWISEATQLVERVIGDEAVELRLRLRRAEAFMAVGALDAALSAARDTEAAAADTRPLWERALLAGHRSLTRSGHHDHARSVFARLLTHGEEETSEDPWVPGLAVLAQAEAHLVDGQLSRAPVLLERALAWLPKERAAHRLRYDALVALGLAEHLSGTADAARQRFAQAALLADECGAHAEAAACAFLSACTAHTRPAAGTLEAVYYAANRLAEVPAAPRALDFPTERIVRLTDAESLGHLRELVFDLARGAGESGELASYVLWCRAAACLYEVEGNAEAGHQLLVEVAESLRQQGHAAAANALHGA